MTRGQRLEAGLALAMLPVSVALALASALGCIALLLFVVPAFVLAIAGAVSWWLPAWCLGAGTVLVWATVSSIEIVSALDWRPLPRVVAAVAIVALAAPFWW